MPPNISGSSSTAAQCAAGEVSGLLSWVIQGIQDAITKHADVVSMSLGAVIDMSTGKGAALKATFDRRTKAATETGLVLVAAAGNGMVDFGGLEDATERAGRAILDKALQAFTKVDCAVTPTYRRGDPSAEILGAAKEHNADLIIMGSRGLGQIGGLILGSVSERVLCGADAPVLIVR